MIKSDSISLYFVSVGDGPATGTLRILNVGSDETSVGLEEKDSGYLVGKGLPFH